MKIKALFIGGLSDGKQLEVEEYLNVVKMSTPMELEPIGRNKTIRTNPTIEFYNKREFLCGGQSFYFFVIEGYRDEDIMTKLINKYRQE